VTGRNQGNTSLRKRRRQRDPMGEFDRLPPELRGWITTAILPWSPRSVQRAYRKAMARYHDTAIALSELDRMEARLVSRDTRMVWGKDHPFSGLDKDHEAYRAAQL